MTAAALGRLAVCFVGLMPICLAGQPVLRIQVLNLAGVDPAGVERAIEEAMWIFKKARIEAQWVHCKPVGDDPSETGICQEKGGGLTVTMGIVAKVPEFLPNTGLGFALVYSGGRNHGGVVYSRVVELARSHPLVVNTDQVLGYAMVHEIAHLILGSTAHSPTGVLRAGCRPAELEAIGQRRLLFTAKESEAMHRKLLERQRREESGRR